MPQIIEQDGQQVEVFTAEELDQERQKAIDEYVADNPGADADQVKELQIKVTSLTEELEKEKKIEKNFSSVRGINKKLEEQLNETTKELNDKVDGLMKAQKSERLEAALGAIAGEDKEMKEKIQKEFEETLANVPDGTIEQFNQKLQKAINIVTGHAAVSVNAGVVSAAGAFGPKPGAGAKPLSPEVKQVASRLGITDEDVKKYDTQNNKS